MNIRNILSFIFLAVILYSCSSSVYNEEIKIPENVWDMNNILKYKVDIPSDSTAYDVSISVRHSQFYPSSNLWLFINIKTPKGAIEKDTLECILAKETGEWLGDGAGDIFDIEIPYRKDVWFTSKGTFEFEIQHGMRTEKLPLIMSVGIKIKETKIDK